MFNLEKKERILKNRNGNTSVNLKKDFESLVDKSKACQTNIINRDQNNGE